MYGQVLETISRYNMLEPGDRVGLAVSGGADSVFLFHALEALRWQTGWQLEVLHLNHGLRGAEADADEEFVAGLAARYEIGFHSRRVDVARLGGNLEQAGREARRAFFLEAMRNLGLRRVATGHTRSDQAETVLHHLVRGAGPAGLAGIAPVTSDGFIRPLLEIEHDQIVILLLGKGLIWREDHTNADISLRRNKLRHEVLPALKAGFNRRVVEALARAAELERAESAYWEKEVGRVWFDGVRSAGGVVEFDAKWLAGLDPALGRRMVRRAVREVRGDLRRLEWGHVEDVLELAASARGSGGVSLPGARVRRSFGVIRIDGGRGTRAPGSVEVVEPGEIEVPEADWGLRVRRALSLSICHGGEADAEPGLYNEIRIFVDEGKAAFPWTVRGWRAGDIYQPAGHEVPAKLKDLFQRAKVPSWKRADWPIVESGGRIAWTREFGPAAWAAPEPASSRLIEIEVIPRMSNSDKAG
jgi:tRNA(Ile)-lysidine synthase